MRSDFSGVFRSRERDAWVAELAAADTCVTPVYSIDELVCDKHLNARGAFIDATDPTHGSFRQLAPVLAGMNRPSGAVLAVDPTRTDTETLLREAGLDPAVVEALREQGIVA